MPTLSEEPKPKFLPRDRRYVVGVDLGQSSDPTAICVIERKIGVIDEGSDFERHTGLPTKQTPKEFLDVRHLQRLQLGMTYPAQVQHVKDLLGFPPLNEDSPAELVIDSTGVGRPVADLFNDAGLNPVQVTITAGNEVTPQGHNRWHVAKTILISTVDALLHTGTLRFASALTEADAMRDELKDFRRKLSDAGRATYAARTGAHDDLVLAVAIACWFATKPKPQPASFGTYGTDVIGDTPYSSTYSTYRRGDYYD
jgi:hypothetical protein